MNAAPGKSVTFVASGGLAPYSFTLLSGSGSVNSSSGAYTPPITRGNSLLQVTDALGSSVTATIENVPIRVNGIVNAIKKASSTQLLLGGQFTSVNPDPALFFFRSFSNYGNPDFARF